MILKVFRRLTEGHNPEVEVIETLAKVGFTAVPEPLASWRKDDIDLAFLQRFLAGATDGWHMALTSLRELFAEYTMGAKPPPTDPSASAPGRFRSRPPTRPRPGATSPPRRNASARSRPRCTWPWPGASAAPR